MILIDKVDNRLTASRGNFGLVWFQGKGKGMPRYVEWCIEAIERWPEFAENLETETGEVQCSRSNMNRVRLSVSFSRGRTLMWK